MREEEKKFLNWLFQEFYNHFEDDLKLEECLKELNHAIVLANLGLVKEVKKEIEKIDVTFHTMKKFLLEEIESWEIGKN